MIEDTSNIAIFISDMGSGGAQRVVRALAAHWSQRGQTITVITHSKASDDFFDLPDGVRRESIGLNKPSHSLLSALVQNCRRVWRLRRALLRAQPSVAIGFIGPGAALLVAAATATGIHTVAAERNDPSLQSFGRLWDKLSMIAYRCADRVTVNSPGAKNTLSDIVATNRLVFTPNPIPIVTSGPLADLVGPNILAVGRLHRQKGFDVLLEAFADLKAPEWRLVIVGDGPEREELEHKSQILGIRERVFFVGTVQDPTPYYRAAQIFALPSRYEGTPNALMEAMCYGLPVVISDASSGPKELLEHRKSGLVTPVDDVGALCRNLQMLVEDAGLREQLANNARATMDERRQCDPAFSIWDKAIDFSEASQAK